MKLAVRPAQARYAHVIRVAHSIICITLSTSSPPIRSCRSQDQTSSTSFLKQSTHRTTHSRQGNSPCPEQTRFETKAQIGTGYKVLNAYVYIVVGWRCLDSVPDDLIMNQYLVKRIRTPQYPRTIKMQGVTN